MTLACPISCSTCRQMISAYLIAEAGRLTAGVDAYPEVAAHLLTCPTCADLTNRSWNQWATWCRPRSAMTDAEQVCRRMQTMLPYYLEQMRINPQMCAMVYPRVAAHFQICPPCRSVLDSLRGSIPPRTKG